MRRPRRPPPAPYQRKDERMDRILLKSKIHRATVTDTRLDYEGSIAIDTDLMAAADLLPNEQVHIYNINNGERFVTYTIPARRGSGMVQLNGAAARLGEPGDRIIIAAYAQVPDAEARTFRPRIVLVDERNRPRPQSGGLTAPRHTAAARSRRR